MAEDEIQAIRPAETAAAARIKDAVAQQDSMLLKAKEDVERNKNDTIQAAAAKEAAALEKVRADCDIMLQDAIKQAEEEIKGLKKVAESRQKEAIELVINALA